MQPVIGRMEFVGANVDAEVKRALRTEARRQGKSISVLIYELLTRDLQDLGHDVPDPTVERTAVQRIDDDHEETTG